MPEPEPLKRCPFCGNEKVEVTHDIGEPWYWVYCWACGAWGGPGETEEQARGHWNLRQGVEVRA